MKRLISFGVLLAVLCIQLPLSAQKKGKLTPTEKENIKTAKVRIVRYEAPPLNFMSPKDVAGEGLVARVTKSDLADSQEAHRFLPSKLVQENIDSLFRNEGLATNVEVMDEAFEFSMPADLKDLSKYADVEADYIVEVIVPLMGWQASYSPTKWRTYWLNLAVEVRIIRQEDLTRIWKTNVGHGGLKDKQLKFHITELEEDGRAKIAGMLDIAALESSKRVVESFVKAKK
ncbi:MAG: hypothetical protein DHS20C17_06700 [Cyclobacteriaceae bacterium]|nr:MAG: hypothetical protein DHS20C17_06700 [Cyclobacteriaceae bacterium]